MRLYTKRETEVLQLICLGYTNLQIAESLNISFHTAKAHVASILQEFDAKNRLQAALKFTKYKSQIVGKSQTIC